MVDPLGLPDQNRFRRSDRIVRRRYGNLRFGLLRTGGLRSQTASSNLFETEDAGLDDAPSAISRLFLPGKPSDLTDAQSMTFPLTATARRAFVGVRRSACVNGISNFPKAGRSKFPGLSGSVVSRFKDVQLHALVGGRGALAVAAV